MFHNESQNVARNTKLYIWSKIAKNTKIANFLVFYTTLCTANSESIAFLPISLHMHVDMLVVNGSSKGQPDWVKGADIM